MPKVEKNGRIALFHKDGAGDDHIMVPLLITSSDERFVLGGDTEGLVVGQRVKLTGRLDSDQTSIDSDGLIVVDGIEVTGNARAQTRTSGSMGVIIAFVSWAGSGTSGYSQYQGDLSNHLTPWSQTASDGAFRWDPVTVVDLVLPNPLRACNPNENPKTDSYWSTTVKDQLSSMGYNLNNYRALGLALPEGFARRCVDTAYAYVGGNCTWGGSYWCNLSVYSYRHSGFATFVHELGHTLPLPHANSARCPADTNKASVTLLYNETCGHNEYGDRYDPMGTSGAISMYNPPFSHQLGWIDGSEIRSFELVPGSSSHSLRLLPYGGLAGTRALRFELPVSSDIPFVSPGHIYLEYRANAGLDGVLYSSNSSFPYGSYCLNAFKVTPNNNLFFRYVPSKEAASKLNLDTYNGSYGLFDESFLLDMTPETSGFCDAGLVPGKSWIDPTGKLRIQFADREADLSSALVNIDYQDIPTKDVNVLVGSGPSQKTPTKNPVISFEIQSNSDLRAPTVTEEDFSVTNGSDLEIQGIGSTFKITVLGLKDGAVTLSPSSSFSVSDLSGNISTTLNSHSIVLDRFIKKPRFIVKPPKVSKRRVARFRWSKDEEATYTCSLKRQRFTKCGVSRRFRKLGKGSYQFRVRAMDAAGNVSTARYAWKVR